MMPDFVQAYLVPLLTLYNGMDRYYHDINHINFCLARYEQFLNENPKQPLPSRDAEALLIAIYFHDAIYNPEAQMVSKGYSEHYSNQLMFGYATEFSRSIHNIDLKTEFTETILLAEKLITATANHGEEHETFLEKLMCDIDLSSLALDWHDFDKNTQNVVMEYAAFRPMDKIVEGNAKFLKTLIDKGTPIFQTEWGMQFEAKAQWNIKHRIANVLPPNEQF
jgi:predicted metal-dependent HD superfamily phosphohydrolase